ncbi:hypothetical protein [Caulobacter sp.]|uniref:hypothetical protein n=1 Tax=Caulobacter sp. TaxID=78 RepID=UPI003BB16C83
MKRVIPLKAGLALAALLSCGLAQPAPAAQKPVVIPLSPYLGVVWSLQAQVKGKAETFLFDSAGGFTVITPQTAAEIGCEPWGQVTGFRMRGDRVDVKRCDSLGFTAGGAAFSAPTAGVWDFSHMLPKDAPPLAGSVGLDAFAGRTITIDLAGKQLVVETPESQKARIADAREVELRLSREASGLALTPFVAVETPKGKIWMELDTGSDAALIVGAHNAALLGMIDEGKAAQPLHAKLAGGVGLDTEIARAMPMILDGNIGAPILAQWIVTLDLAHGRAWIAPAKPQGRP